MSPRETQDQFDIRAHNVETNLCKMCREIAANWDQVLNYGPRFDNISPWRPREFGHWSSIFMLEASAKAGCNLCLNFFHSLETNKKYSEMRGAFTEALSKTISIVGIVEAKSTGGVWSKPGRTSIMKLAYKSPDRLRPIPLIDWAHGISVYSIPSHPLNPLRIPEDNGQMNGENAMSLCKDWLQNCHKTHQSCGANTQSNDPPTRLLFIGKQTTSTMSLRTTSELSKDNVKSFCQDIPLDSLCKTFKDAIHTATQMNISYIWIDSLCIIQDDLADWERESRRMCDVYLGAFLNIAAAGAVDGRMGCFIDRSERWKCQLEIILDSGTYRHDCIPISYWNTRMLAMPLMARGWAFQERLLSRRKLFFTSTEIFWECSEFLASETFPLGVPHDGRRIDTQDCDQQLQGRQITRSLWPYIIEQYSRRKLTYGSDKLVAISGVAKYIQSQEGGERIAGMWRSDLGRQLDWSTQGGDRSSRKLPVTRPEPRRAPTWSWASIDEPVYFRPLRDGSIYADTKDDPLCIEILEVRRRAPSESEIPRGVCEDTLIIRCPSLISGRVDLSDMRLYGENMVESFFIAFDCACDLSNQFHLLPITIHSIHGLVLQLTKDAKGQYERVGYFDCYLDLPEFEEMSKNVEHRVPDEDYLQIVENLDGTIERVIELV